MFVDFSKAFDTIHRGKTEKILLTYGPPKDTVTSVMIRYKNMKAKVRLPDGDTDFFNIGVGVLQGDTLATYLSIICPDCLLRMSIDLIKENDIIQKRQEADNILQKL